MQNWGIFDSVKEYRKYLDLLYILTWRDIKIKYKQSIMGFMWAIFMPLLIVAAGMLVRYAFSKLSGEPLKIEDIAAVSVKAIPWAFFVSSIRFATLSMISNSDLVTKIYFPRELFPLSAVISQFFDFVVASITITFILGFMDIGLSLHLFWIPILIGLLFLFVLSCGIMLSAFALFFRDVKYIVEVFLTFGIFFTPVFYEVELFREWSFILLLNPIAPILEGINFCVVKHQVPDIGWLAYSAFASLTTFVLAYYIFKKLEPSFAESI